MGEDALSQWWVAGASPAQPPGSIALEHARPTTEQGRTDHEVQFVDESPHQQVAPERPASHPYTLTPDEFWRTTAGDFLALLEYREALLRETERRP